MNDSKPAGEVKTSGPAPKFTDITLYDQDTGEPFIFTAKEQEFYWRQGFTNVPKRSPERRKLLRDQKTDGKPVFNIACKSCGRVGKVYNEPALPKEVYCKECFEKVWAEHLEKHPEVAAEHARVEAEIAAQKAV